MDDQKLQLSISVAGLECLGGGTRKERSQAKALVEHSLTNSDSLRVGEPSPSSLWGRQEHWWLATVGAEHLVTCSLHAGQGLKSQMTG
jgi:hypothetical protein